MKINKVLFAVCTMVLLFAFGCTANSQSQSGKEKEVQNIDQSKYHQLVKNENAIVIDVRTPSEVEQGVIKDASVFADIKGDNFAQIIEKLDTSKTYIVYCRSGARSKAAAEYMFGKGFQKVYNLDGGISGWKGETTKP